MPNSHFNLSIKGVVETDPLDGAVAAWLAGAEAVGIAIEASVLQQTVPVAAPTASGEGTGYDVTVSIPNFSAQPGVTYLLNYTDNGGLSYAPVGYEVLPNTPVIHANGHQPGRQYSIFGDSLPGELSTPLP